MDPGLIRTGYGIIEADSPEKVCLVEAGVITTSSSDNITLRLNDIYSNMVEVIDDFAPSVMVLEKLYSHYKHPVTSILMGHARGVICLAAGTRGLPLVNYASTRIKKAVTGNGRAGKHQLQRMVKNILCLKQAPEPFDISDALAIATSYVYIEMVG